jgi:type III secretion system FlhB-like substrate exporter
MYLLMISQRNNMKRKVTSLSEEAEILNELDKGLGNAVVRQLYSAIKRIIGFIKEIEDRIRRSIRSGQCPNA